MLTWMTASQARRWASLFATRRIRSLSSGVARRPTLLRLTLHQPTSVASASTVRFYGSSNSSTNDNTAPVDFAQLQAARDGSLSAALAMKRERLARMEEVKHQCEDTAYRYPDTFMKRLFAFLLLQAAVLFDWTYIHFDWNLVEPITYLIGYSATWIAIGWYGMMQHEFSYDSMRRLLQDSEKVRLYAAHQFDVTAYETLRAEVRQLERILRSLEGIRSAPEGK